MVARVEAAVIGGGPAGAVTAMLLARSGRRVLLVDRGPPGRDKACGHCLGEQVMPLVRRLGLEPVVVAATVGRTRGLRVLFEHAGELRLPLGGVVVERRTLDRGLVLA